MGRRRLDVNSAEGVGPEAHAHSRHPGRVSGRRTHREVAGAGQRRLRRPRRGRRPGVRPRLRRDRAAHASSAASRTRWSWPSTSTPARSSGGRWSRARRWAKASRASSRRAAPGSCRLAPVGALLARPRDRRVVLGRTVPRGAGSDRRRRPQRFVPAGVGVLHGLDDDAALSRSAGGDGVLEGRRQRPHPGERRRGRQVGRIALEHVGGHPGRDGPPQGIPSDHAENRWLAQHYGVLAFLGDISGAEGRVDIEEHAARLVEDVADDAREIGCERELRHVLTVISLYAAARCVSPYSDQSRYGTAAAPTASSTSIGSAGWRATPRKRRCGPWSIWSLPRLARESAPMPGNLRRRTARTPGGSVGRQAEPEATMGGPAPAAVHASRGPVAERACSPRRRAGSFRCRRFRGGSGRPAAIAAPGPASASAR